MANRSVWLFLGNIAIKLDPQGVALRLQIETQRRLVLTARMLTGDDIRETNRSEYYSR